MQPIDIFRPNVIPFDGENLGELLNVFETHCHVGDWVFRGQAYSSWALEPRICRGRLPLDPAAEETLLCSFRERLLQLFPDRQMDDWMVVALAQHHGGPTRLLDWTRDHRIALWFALDTHVREQFGKPTAAAVWCCVAEPGDWITNGDRYSDAKFGFVEPTFRHPRVEVQKSVFSVHPKPRSVADQMYGPHVNWSDKSSGMLRIDIPARLTSELLRSLEGDGIDAAQIYPDLDGFCRQMRNEFLTLPRLKELQLSVGVPWSKSASGGH